MAVRGSLADIEQELSPSLEAYLLERFQYMRFAFADVNGISRGKISPIRHAIKYLKTGIPLATGSTLLPSDTEMAEAMIGDLLETGFPNGLLRADLSSIHAIPWADVKDEEGVTHFGEVFCEMFMPDRRFADLQPENTYPRYVALQQIKRLEEQFGLTLQSGYEAEFSLLNKDRSPLFEGKGMILNACAARFHPLLVEFERNLLKAGVDINAIHLEYEPGQFELNTAPAAGINSADQMFILKQGLHEMCDKRGLIVSFMSQLLAKQIGNGTHFNLSLLDKKTGKNVMGDPTKDDGISDLARHWIAGLVHYGPSVCLMFAPTLNCYRRFTAHDVPPTHCRWGIDDRLTAYRIKVDTPSGVYLENRIPSALSNPYLVLAATLAAGMQGLTDQLECPPPKDENAPALPKTIEEAMNKLEADELMVKALGKPIIKGLIDIRRIADAEKFKDSDLSEIKPADIEKEIAYFEPYM